MNKINILLLACVFSVTMLAQTTKADRLFDNWEYYEAAQLYKNEADKNPGADVYYKLGECYRKMNSYKKEEQEAYDKVNAAGVYKTPEFYLNYGQVLKNNGHPEKAKIAFDMYAKLVPSDPRGKFFSESIGIVDKDHATDAPVKVSNLKVLNSEKADFSPVFFKDGVVFTSSRKTPGHGKIYPWTGANYLDMYYAKKGSKIDDFTEVSPFEGKKNNKKYHDGPACFSKNFDTIYIARVEKYLEGQDKKDLGIERSKIFISAFEDGKWQTATPFQYNSDLYSLANPFLAPGGKRIYFVSDMPGGFGKTDIYYCDRQGDSWNAPVNMGSSVNTFNDERYPSMDESGNFYFSSNGYQGFGGMDICVALNQGGSLQKAKVLKSPMNSSYDDNGILFLQNGKLGYITSNRTEGGQGDDDMLYFDFTNADPDLIASIYTIGYQPKVTEEEVAVVETVEPVIVIKKVRAPINTEIYFDYAKYDIRYDAVQSLDSIADYMKSYQDQQLIIGGHTDSRGTAQYNIYLSIFRNNSVIAYLGKKGIDQNRIEATAYGLSDLVNNCEKGIQCSDSEHQLNRNVTFSFKPSSNARINKDNSKDLTGKEHIVKKNETIYSISKMHNMSVENLKKINNLKGDTIVVGQVLVVSL